MIVKPQYVPFRLLADQALLDHLPRGIPEHATIEDDLARAQAGWRGEQELAFRLSMFPDESVRIFYDLGLSTLHNTFQIDAFLLTQRFAACLEAKNYSGTLTFLPDGQLIRTLGNRREGLRNPLIQVQRHVSLLTHWIAARQFPKLAVKPRVAIANNATMIENPSHLQNVATCVTHAEQIPSHISRLIQELPQQLTSEKLLQIEQQLLAAHADSVPNVFAQFKIDPQTVRRGVRCPRCKGYTMKRAFATWHCVQCGATDRTAHIPMILDYFLLFGPTMTNEQCRWFLKVEDRKLIRNLLIKMNFNPVGKGTGQGLYYERPAHKIYHDYYVSNKNRNEPWNHKYPVITSSIRKS
ncbi:hypothetical protein JOC27_002672 [Sporolactobacillus spathodeae]|uniref:NERD domain-containing protein n=1 Tax=Sporolactobacillus spathodeae TaxID=1465502 RepID=A0ABS2QBI3_9BACL|nr:nuclease-related domain-containing protein [Sporolactobacillus spathodeae]MBM7659167.1 hypothetical protein [Sporolactobacillus spathodeae]